MVPILTASRAAGCYGRRSRLPGTNFPSFARAPSPYTYVTTPLVGPIAVWGRPGIPIPPFWGTARAGAALEFAGGARLV